jgi:hypothetical protein
MEGSESGSGRPKNFRIRIHDTVSEVPELCYIGYGGSVSINPTKELTRNQFLVS